MAMGMSYDEFWFGSPIRVKYYYRAEQIKAQKQSELQWLQGFYFYDALTAALSNFSSGLGGKKGQADYRKEPIRVTPKTKEELEAEKQRKLQAYIESLKQYKANFDAKHKGQK